jgi:hypothetical protein
MQRSLLKWEIAGTIVIFLLGAAFHFGFSLTGSHTGAGVFFPVNESVFEHLKMTFWPSIIWALFSYGFIKSSASNFLTAKAAAVITMPVVTVILFYAYTAITADNAIADIAVFFVAVAAGQYVSYLLLKARPLPAWVMGLSALVIVLLGALYAMFTYYPPYTSFFMDSNTGGFGIPAE